MANADGGDVQLFGGTSTERIASTAAFQDQFHDHMQTRFASQDATTPTEPVLMADNSQGSSAGVGSIMNYAGYLTYAGLAAGAFGHDDPLNLQLKATRFFQEKILHHHAIDNPQVWEAMGDALMTEQHLASQGAKFKPLKLGTLKSQVKHENKTDDQELAQNGKEANAIIQDITGGLRSPDDYVLAAKFMYSEAIEKADERAAKEKIDHKDEKRLLGRLGLLSGETDRVDASGTRNGSINPLLDELGASVSYRLDEAAMMDRYGSQVPALGWSKESADLRTKALEIFNNPTALNPAVRTRLQKEYPDFLKSTAVEPSNAQPPAPGKTTVG